MYKRVLYQLYKRSRIMYTIDLFDFQHDRIDAARRAKEVLSLDEVQPDFVPSRRQLVLHRVKEARSINVSGNALQQIHLRSDTTIFIRWMRSWRTDINGNGNIYLLHS